jgi:glycosyltransferase involved in cell wall biosynthesis
LFESSTNRWRSYAKRGLNKVVGKDLQLKKKLSSLSFFDVVLFNTVASFKIISLLPSFVKTKCVAYLHEQPFSANAFYRNEFTKENVLAFDHLITVSSQTKKYLVEKFGVAEETVSIIHPFIEIKRFIDHISVDAASTPGLKPFVIGGCGLQDWRKGPDLFLQAAKLLSEKHKDVNLQFVWVGAESGMTAALQYEIEQLQLKDKVVFTGAEQNVADRFKQFNIFLLTSREDPFPLVVLEACALAKPVICFENVGDIAGLVGTIPENVVPYSNVAAMVDRILIYLKDGQRAGADGSQLKEKVLKYDVEVGAPAVYKQLLQIVQEKLSTV